MSDSNHSSRETKTPERKENLKETTDHLESLLTNSTTITYDPTCIRKKSNLSKGGNEYKFDSLQFSRKELLNKIPNVSPKLDALLNQIKRLDKKDMDEHGKLFKHFIFSDVKSGTHGARLITSAMIASGYHLGYSAELKNPDDKAQDEPDRGDEDAPEKKEKRYKKMELFTDEKLRTTKNKNVLLLSSVMVYDQPTTVKTKKEILLRFNQRPENAHGELIRFIVLDSGYKEGIDLFDVKYVHMFEPSVL
jgi:hypothetical protein